MKKLILVFLVLSAISNADILYLKKKICIRDDYYFKDGKFFYTYSQDGSTATAKVFRSTDLDYGYVFENAQCKKKEPFASLHMSYHDYKFMMALVGSLIGFSIFASLLFIFTRRF